MSSSPDTLMRGVLARMSQSAKPLLALLSTLVLTCGIQVVGPTAATAATPAEASSGQSAAETTSTGSVAQETSSSGAEDSKGASETPAPEQSTSSEAPPQGASVTPPPEPGTPAEKTAEPEPVAPETPATAPVEAIEPPAPETPAEPIVEIPPAPEAPVQPVLETPAPEATVTKPTGNEAPPAHRVTEEVSGSPQTSASNTTQTITTQSAAGGTTDGPEVLGEPPPAAPSGPADLIATIQKESSQPSLSSVRAPAKAPKSIGGTGPLAGEASCELSSTAGSCTVAWLSTRNLIADSSTYAMAPAKSLAADITAGADDPGSNDEGGATLVSRPAGPSPGPAPSGASGASAVGGSGAAPSAFLSLAGQLRLAGPLAMRRLRLSCQPWLTAFFVLIPERPG